MKVISKEKISLEKTVSAYNEYRRVLDDIEAAKEMTKDADMKEFAEEELSNLEPRKAELE